MKGETNCYMTIRDMLPKVIHNRMTYHEALGNNVELLPDDRIRVYKGDNGVIHKMIYTCDYKDIALIPDEVLDLEFDIQDNWLIGGTLSIDFIIKDVGKEK